MKITCQLESLKSAVSNAEKVTGKHVTLPVLEAVLLSADENHLVVRATNLQVGVEIEVEADIAAAGTVALPGKVLASILSSIPGKGKITLEETDGSLTISTSESTVTLKKLDPQDFPTLPAVETTQCISLKVSKLVEMLRSVVYAAATTDIKPEIASVYINSDPEQGGMVFVATDSFRLAETRIKTPDTLEQGVLIGVKNIQDILRIFQDREGDVVMCVGEHQVSFSSDEVFCTSRLIDGVFPDYRRIIPTEFVTNAKVVKKDLVQTLRLVNVFTDRFMHADLDFDPETSTITINTKNAAIGEQTSVIKAKIEGEPASVRVNYRYLSECFQSIHEDSVEFLSAGEGRPLVVKGVGNEAFTYLIMPMRR